MRPGFYIDADLVFTKGKKKFTQSFPINVNSTNPLDIQKNIDYWRKTLTLQGDSRKLVVNAVYRIEKISV